MCSNMNKFNFGALGKALMFTGGLMVLVPTIAWLVTKANPIVLLVLAIIVMVVFFYNIFKD